MQNPDNQAALTLKNFDTATHITRLQTKLGNVNTLTTDQKSLELARKNKTADSQKATYDLYNDASGVINAMAGLLGPGTNAAKKLQEIRSKLRRHDTANPPATASAPKP